MCTREIRIKSTRKTHKTTKKHKRRGEKWRAALGRMRFNPTGFTVRTKLKWHSDVVPSRGRKNTLVRTRRMNVRANQPYCPDNQKYCPDIRDHHSDVPKTLSRCFTQKNLKKRGKRVEKYFPNNFQSTHVYNTDILVQLAF
jgi:hypothetical protein